MGKKKTASLISDLLEPDNNSPDKQWQAAILLGKLGPNKTGEEVISALVKTLKLNFGALVRSHAAEALGMLEDKKAVDALILSLNDPYRLTRSYAARSLGKLGDNRAVQPLLEVMKNDDFFGARAEAAEALGKLCDDEMNEECKKVRRALLAQKKAENERTKSGKEEGRATRVLGEVEKSLEKMEMLMEEMEKKHEEIREASDQEEYDRIPKLMQELDLSLKKFKTTMLGFS